MESSTMHVAALRLDLAFDTNPTPRAARQAARGIAEHLRRHFNVSACDLDPGPGPHHAGLAIVSVAPRKHDARDTLERVADALKNHPHARVADRIRILEL